MLGKFVLWLSAIMFMGYGLACLFSPDLPANLAGLSIGNGDALAEMGAMYGGLQTGFGAFCLLGALRTDYYRAALVLLLLCIGALALARCFWAFSGDGTIGVYTYGALVYEYSTAILAAVALALRR